MSHLVTIAEDNSNIVLPNGLRYDGGAQVLLSDREYSLLSASFKGSYLSADVIQGGDGSGPGGVTVAGLGLGLITYNPLPMTISNTSISPQQIFWFLVTASLSKQVSYLAAHLWTPGVTPGGSGVNELALYPETGGAPLTSTGDMTTAFEDTSNNWAEGACTPYGLVAGTNYYLAVTSNFTGTPPHLYYVGQDDFPAVNGHYLYLYRNGITALPTNFDPATESVSSALMLMRAR